ncbi:hypothetical protein [Sphingobium sp.]|uniref:hypothetical protein n=1 Tax=Sphingobium sp. TaxID=1912891 RepID=UPI000DB38E85|nr:hypothetical protein [Sphingobium sp.]PZU63807.1 MAG: hypothetical protein DI540_22855 [Sphingobium sp.]
MSSSTYRTGDDLIFGFWLIFDKLGDVRMTRRPPSLARDERAVSMDARLPLALWDTPTLRAQLVVNADAAPTVNLEIATEALKSALGVDIDLQVKAQDGDGA